MDGDTAAYLFARPDVHELETSQAKLRELVPQRRVWCWARLFKFLLFGPRGVN